MYFCSLSPFIKIPNNDFCAITALLGETVLLQHCQMQNHLNEFLKENMQLQATWTFNRNIQHQKQTDFK